MEVNVPPNCTGDAEVVWKWYLETLEKRPTLDFWIDGVVTGLDDIEAQLALGLSSNRPKGMRAIKFPSTGKNTVLASVAWQVGASGAIVPSRPFHAGGHRRFNGFQSDPVKH